MLRLPFLQVETTQVIAGNQRTRINVQRSPVYGDRLLRSFGLRVQGRKLQVRLDPAGVQVNRLTEVTFGDRKVVQALIDGSQEQISLKVLRIKSERILSRGDRPSKVASLHVQEGQVMMHDDRTRIYVQCPLLPYDRFLIIPCLLCQQTPHKLIVGLRLPFPLGPFGYRSGGRQGYSTVPRIFGLDHLRGHAPLTEHTQPQQSVEALSGPPRPDHTHPVPHALLQRSATITVPSSLI